MSVSLDKGCYRHIRISSADTLERLHSAILEAFGFEDDHAHAFFLDNRLWSDADSYYSAGIEDAERLTKDHTLGGVGLRPGRPFKYVFDFGEEWAFQLKVLRVLEAPTDAPQVIRSVGKAPGQYDEDEDSFLPELYSREQLMEQHEALALPPATAELLHRYFDAFAHLYGILPIRKVLEIYNQQNPPIDEQIFAQFIKIMYHEDHPYAILGPHDLYTDTVQEDAPLDREIIEVSLLEDEERYDEMKVAQEGKPYYIPLKAELLRYENDRYYEKNASFMALRDFLRDHIKLSIGRADDIAGELQLHASMAETNMQYIMDDMKRMGLEFQGIEDLRSFMTLYTEMANNTRMAINRGHTPKELSTKSGPPREIRLGPGIAEAVRRGDMNINDLRKGVLQMNFPNADMMTSYLKELRRIEREVNTEQAPSPTPSNGKSISRNGPCPCGSGKKYKRCCGRH